MVYPFNGILLSHKRNGILTHASTWMNLVNMLSERSQAQKDTYCMILFICNIQNRYINRDKTQIGGCPRLGAGENGGRRN